MKREELLKKIRRRARQDEKNRRDLRFLDTMAFFVAKGFLKTNMRLPLRPNTRVRLDDAIWAGQNVEPRIFEVLPAAILRLGRHFDLDADKHADLAHTVAQLRGREEHGDSFQGIPYAKLKVWAETPLRDRRVKPTAEKKAPKTFRLHPIAIERLERIARDRDMTVTAALEKLIADAVV
jgi:hypothetical protein